MVREEFIRHCHAERHIQVRPPGTIDVRADSIGPLLNRPAAAFEPEETYENQMGYPTDVKAYEITLDFIDI